MEWIKKKRPRIKPGQKKKRQKKDKDVIVVRLRHYTTIRSQTSIHPYLSRNMLFAARFTIFPGSTDTPWVETSFRSTVTSLFLNPNAKALFHA